MMMASNSSSIVSSLSWVIIKFFLLSFLATILFPSTAHGGNFYSDFNITWGPDKAKIYEGGNLMTLSLDNTSGSAFITYNEYLFGKIDMQMKLVPGNSAGTVTTLYLSALGPLHDEIDFEFLGNETGQPYTIHTNLFARGKGDREMQFRVWFDPTADFHTYTILWNPLNVIWMVDGVPIRVFKNNEQFGIPFPKDQPMKLYSSLWSADDWATQGGRVKTNWALAPFTAAYRFYNADACFVYSGMACQTKPWYKTQVLPNPDWVYKMQTLQNTYMIYNYCTDFKRFPQGVPSRMQSPLACVFLFFLVSAGDQRVFVCVLFV